MIAKHQSHSVDIFFTLSLFFVFAFCALSVIVFGAGVYQNTAADMQQNFTSRTAMAYVTEKLRQNDKENAVSVFSLDGMDVLCISETINDREYNTYIYCFEGSLYELLLPAEREFSPKMGQDLLDVSSLQVTSGEQGLLNIACTDRQGNLSQVSLYLRCAVQT